MWNSLILITVICTLVSCGAAPVDSSDDAHLDPISVKKYSADHFSNHLKNAGTQMGLPRIDTGVNGFELRIWTASMIDPDNLVVLRKLNHTTIAQLFDYKYSSDSVQHYKMTQSYNNSMLNKFADSLAQISFSSFLSQNEIPGFQDNIADGMTFHMEIAKPGYYKLLTYHCPERFAKRDSNNKKFLDLLMAADKHLHFYSPVCGL
jgi:hypothetical protein